MPPPVIATHSVPLSPRLPWTTPRATVCSGQLCTNPAQHRLCPGPCWLALFGTRVPGSSTLELLHGGCDCRLKKSMGGAGGHLGA